MKKQLLFTFLSIILVCVTLLGIPVTQAKYVVESEGRAYQIDFALNKNITATFGIDNPEGDTSSNLWGAAGDDGKVTTGTFGSNLGYINQHSLGKLGTQVFSVYNDTDVPMLITFDFLACLHPDFLGTPTFSIINNSNNATITGTFVFDSSKAGGNKVLLDQGDVAYSVFLAGTYYYYSTNIDPQKIDADADTVLKGFVLQPKQSFSFTLQLTYKGSYDNDDTLFQCYASIKMNAIPYKG